MTDRRTQVGEFIARQRWFGGKGRAFSVGGITPVGLGLHLVDLAYEDGDRETWQLPLASYAEPRADLEPALIGEWDGQWHYDAVWDPASTRAWLQAMADGASVDDLTARHVDGQEIRTDLDPTVFAGEQSNSSIDFSQTSMLKVFRKLTPGVNPDIEVTGALTRAGSPHVARLLGWLESADLQLGMLQEFLRDSRDGWSLALATLRDGDDFTGASHALGVAVAEVHATLREVMIVDTIPGREVVSRMHARLDDALHAAPGLSPRATTLRDLIDGLAGAGVPAQRIHADLHLGQVLRTADGWKLVDFEGEPARSLDERALPDSPWRDVAGMVRSFGYAAAVADREHGATGSDWVARNREAFLSGYQSATAPFTDQDLELIRAFEVDKAIYEVTYEARNRPDWIDIPLGAIAQILEERA